jgi:hypothetical protein
MKPLLVAAIPVRFRQGRPPKHPKAAAGAAEDGFPLQLTCNAAREAEIRVVREIVAWRNRQACEAVKRVEPRLGLHTLGQKVEQELFRP